VIQASVVLHAPESMLATETKQDFEASYKVVQEMIPTCLMAERAFPILQNLRQSVNSTINTRAQSPFQSPGQS